MNNSLIQPTGSVSIKTNIQSISRVLGIDESKINYVTLSIIVDNFVVLYEKTSQQTFLVGSAKGTLLSYNINSDNTLSIVTNIGNYILSPINNLFGRIFYNDIRNYSGNSKSINCSGIVSVGDGGEGIFSVDISDTVTVDNNCTVLVDILGRRWKREFTGNIKGEWAGIKTILESSTPQDDAFENCLLAAAASSDSGYPQRIIEMPKNGTIKLARQHKIRCGVFKESDDWVPSNNLGTRFGIIGKFALDGNGGFFIVQANSPYFDIEIDNTGMTYTTTPTLSNYALRMEAMVMNPEVHIKAHNYPGTPWYSLGKGATSEVSAIWSDLSMQLPSIQNLNHSTMRINTCGRGFYFKNTGSGFGHISSIWEQNNTSPSQLVNMYDVTIDKYEDFVPPLLLTGGLIIDSCGTITMGKLLIGSGGGPHVSIWDTPAISIERIFAVCGGPTYAQTNPNAYALEICNSRVCIGIVNASYPGEFLRLGYNAWVSIDSLDSWYLSRVATLVNDSTKLAYRGSRVGQLTDTAELIINSARCDNLNYFAGGYSARSCFYVDSTVYAGELTLNNCKFRNTHSGWTGTTEAQTYIVEVKTNSNTFFFNSENSKWDDNNFNYVIFLNNEYQLGNFQSSQTNFARIRYSSGNQSTYGMRDSLHPELGTTAIPTNGTNFTYSYRRPGKYHGDLTVPSGGTAIVSVNGQVLYNYITAGTYPVNLILYFQEIVTITVTGAVTLTNSTWRYTI